MLSFNIKKFNLKLKLEFLKNIFLHLIEKTFIYFLEIPLKSYSHFSFERNLKIFVHKKSWNWVDCNFISKSNLLIFEILLILRINVMRIYWMTLTCGTIWYDIQVWSESKINTKIKIDSVSKKWNIGKSEARKLATPEMEITINTLNIRDHRLYLRSRDLLINAEGLSREKVSSSL